MTLRTVLWPLALTFATAMPLASADDASIDVPSKVFLQRLQSLCGLAFEGHVAVDTPAEPTNPFAGKTLLMHVRECPEDGVRIPFHVGDDRSRTWVLTRAGSGLRLKHDHRHADGTPDATTLYGGDTTDAGTAERQQFPVDAESITLFRAEGREVSTSNTWAMEIRPGEQFVYELSRPGGRLFRVVFDLRQPVDAPPAPWGAEL
ncbi:MAG: hypothetical protein BWZ07_00896 [Alphaproteobacteria bacterium ADurb.BinA280]|jgi:hypothetical protein|nr:hypothetical protein [Xanthomonadales bacterium]MCC6504945.1 hypothetical protein [Aquimonas sp.]OPZ13008.1 MAG: hypothetical protein BWZ07_00896 [Alphaproteobacteria bacterium ADurb.BinA280]